LISVSGSKLPGGSLLSYVALAEAARQAGIWAASLLLDGQLERLPIRWKHLIEKETLKFKELEHVLIEKAGQLFGTGSRPITH
jgi:hypothetical protein